MLTPVMLTLQQQAATFAKAGFIGCEIYLANLENLISKLSEAVKPSESDIFRLTVDGCS